MTKLNNANIGNRYGLNILIYDQSDWNTPLVRIPYANMSELELTRDTVWATEGQKRGKTVGFYGNYAGTFKLSTQIQTMELLGILMDKAITSQHGNIILFGTRPYRAPRFYTIVAETVWKGTDGGVYGEKLTLFKLCAKRALNLTYSGDGEPLSMDVEFDILDDDYGRVIEKGEPVVIVVDETLLTIAGSYLGIDETYVAPSTGVSVVDETLIMEA